jgi:hypothetical protein
MLQTAHFYLGSPPLGYGTLAIFSQKLSPSSTMKIDEAGHIIILILLPTGLHGVITQIFTTVEISNHNDH